VTRWLTRVRTSELRRRCHGVLEAEARWLATRRGDNGVGAAAELTETLSSSGRGGATPALFAGSVQVAAPGSATGRERLGWEMGARRGLFTLPSLGGVVKKKLDMVSLVAHPPWHMYEVRGPLRRQTLGDGWAALGAHPTHHHTRPGGGGRGQLPPVFALLHALHRHAPLPQR
jgi:hypothetical protein